MPSRKEDDSEPEGYLSDGSNVGINIEDEPVPNSKTAVIETSAGLRTQPHQRSLEWSFFKDAGKFGASTKSNHRNAECKQCGRTVRSKRETMFNHIRSCHKIPEAVKQKYYDSDSSWKPRTSSTKSALNTGNIRTFFQPSLSKSNYSRIQDEMLRAAIDNNVSFNAICSPSFTKLFRLLNPTFNPTSASTLRTSVLSRVSKKERDMVDNAYKMGAYVTLTCDGWKTPGHRKWIGQCSILRSKETDSITIDTRRFEDVTTVGENTFVIFREIKKEIESIMDAISKASNNSTLVCVITDSAKPNLVAKQRLAVSFPNIMFLPCHAHQLNLMAGNVLNHASTKPIIESAVGIINYFHNYQTQYSKLQRIMRETSGKEFKFVQECDTRWYSHYQMVLSLFRARPYLEKYKSAVQDNDPILSKPIATKSLDAIGSSSFWRKLGLVSEILRVLTIEIGNIERKKAGMSDVIQSFGRIWVFLHDLSVYQSHRFHPLPSLLEDLLKRWDWRINIYFDVDLLILSHVLDPLCGMKGFQAASVSRKRVFQILIKLANKFLPNFTGDASGLQDMRQHFVQYLVMTENTSNLQTGAENPYTYWLSQACIDFAPNSPLRRIALFIFAASASAADLERVWSSCLKTLVPQRRKLKKAKVLQTVQIKSSIRMEQASAQEQRENEQRKKAQEAQQIDLDLQTSSQNTLLSEIREKTDEERSVSSASSSSDSEVEKEDLMSQVLNEMEYELLAENIQEQASTLLENSSQEAGLAPDIYTDAEIDAFLNSEVQAPLKKKARKLPNYRKVTQHLSTLFDFDVYKEKAKTFYENNLD